MAPKILAASLAVFFLLLVSAYGGSSPNVPIEDHVYRDIDQLVAAGLIKDAIYGQRPWSRNEIARMIVEARRSFTDGGAVSAKDRKIDASISIQSTIEKLEREYRDEIDGDGLVRVHWLDEATAEAAYLDSPSRAVPTDNGVGFIKASVNPLISYREGRHYANGRTFALESVHWATLSRYFSIYASPRLEALDPDKGPSNLDIRAQRLYGKLTLNNLEIEAGRDSLIWGPGEHGGVLASNNARNLDMGKVSNDSPWTLPWIFKYFGPSKYTFFVADLGASYVFSHAYLYGGAASFKPAPFLEIGFEHQVTVGGKGSPDADLGDLFAEFFVFRRGDVRAHNVADHRAGMNARIQLPWLHRATVYGEGIFEDFGRESFWPQFKQQMGALAGIYFPLLTADGSNDLRIEYEHIPAEYGRQSIWTSGLTQDDVLRGSEIGPDGQGIHVTWRHVFPSGTTWKNTAHYETRDSNLYTTSLSSAGGPDQIVMVEERPSETRFRATSCLEWKANERVVIRPEFGYERVWGADFKPGADRNNFMAAVSIRWTTGR